MFDPISLFLEGSFRLFRRSPLGAAAGMGIGLILLALALYTAWPRGVQDDPGIGLTFIIFVGAIPFLLLSTAVGVLVGKSAEDAKVPEEEEDREELEEFEGLKEHLSLSQLTAFEAAQGDSHRRATKQGKRRKHLTLKDVLVFVAGGPVVLSLAYLILAPVEFWLLAGLFGLSAILLPVLALAHHRNTLRYGPPMTFDEIVQEQDPIRMVQLLRYHLGWSPSKIKAELNRLGVKNRGLPWRDQDVEQAVKRVRRVF